MHTYKIALVSLLFALAGDLKAEVTCSIENLPPNYTISTGATLTTIAWPNAAGITGLSKYCYDDVTYKTPPFPSSYTDTYGAFVIVLPANQANYKAFVDQFILAKVNGNLLNVVMPANGYLGYGWSLLVLQVR